MLFIFSLILIAGLTVRALATGLGMSVARFGVILVYLGNPALLNELQAGHLFFVASYALLPLVAALAIRPPTRYTSVVVGAVMGWCAAQQQFLPFAFLLLIALGQWQRKFFFTITVPAVLVAIAVTAPQWILLTAPHAAPRFGAALTLPHWELASSASLADSLRMIGYIGHYDGRIPGWVRDVILWCLPGSAILGCIAARNDRRARIFAVLGTLSVLLMSGLQGPLAVPLAYAFAHIRPFVLYRELYNFSALAGLGYAVLCGFALQALWRLLPRKWPVVVFAGITFASVTMCTFTAMRALTGLPALDIASGSAAIAAVADSPGSGRYITVPGVAPLSNRREGGGLSPFLIPLAGHASALAPLASYPETYLARRLASDGLNENTRTLLRRSGVSHILWVPKTRTHFSVEPALRGLAPATVGRPPHVWRSIPVGGSLVSVEPFTQISGTLASQYRGAADLQSLEGGVPVNLFTQVSSPNPRQSWAALTYWPTLPVWTFAAPTGIFTLRGSAQTRLPAALLVVGSANGQVRASGCFTLRRLDAHFEILRCGPRPMLRGRPPIVLSSASVGGRLRPWAGEAQGSYGRATIDSYTPWRLVADVDASPGSALVLRQSYDPSWSLSATPAKHVKVDGFANGWVLPDGLHGRVTMFYRPALGYFIALYISMLVSLAGAVLAFTDNAAQKTQEKDKKSYAH